MFKREPGSSTFKQHMAAMDQPLLGNVRDDIRQEVPNAKFIHRYNKMIIPIENELTSLTEQLAEIEKNFGTDLTAYTRCQERIALIQNVMKVLGHIKQYYVDMDALMEKIKTELNLIPLGWGGANYVGTPCGPMDHCVLYFKTNDKSPLRFGFRFAVDSEGCDGDCIDFSRWLVIHVFSVTDPYLKSIDVDDIEPSDFTICEYTDGHNQFLSKPTDNFTRVLTAIGQCETSYLLTAEIEHVLRVLHKVIDEETYENMFRTSTYSSPEISDNDLIACNAELEKMDLFPKDWIFDGKEYD